MKIESLFSPEEKSALDSSASEITKISEAVHDKNRVNIFVDDRFFCSLDISQLVDLKLKVGQKLDESSLESIKKASNFGKLYSFALSYALLRPRSQKEIKDYLSKKTLSRPVRTKNLKTGQYQTKIKEGFDKSLIDRS